MSCLVIYELQPIKHRLQPRVHAAQPGDHFGRPVKVSLFALGGPVSGRGRQDVAQIADLVGQLDQLSLRRDVRRVLNLYLAWWGVSCTDN